MWGIGASGNGVADEGEPGSGNLVPFSIQDFIASPGGDHGQLCASGVAGQGITNAAIGTGRELPDRTSRKARPAWSSRPARVSS